MSGPASREPGAGTLGGSPVDVPSLVVGGMFRDPEGRREVLERALDASIDHGLDAIDTAPLYGFGAGERLVGRWLANRSARPRLLTKVGLRWDDDHGEVLFEAEIDGRRRAVRRDGRPEAIRRDVEGSLARLGVECLDLVQIHHRDRDVPLAESLGALEDLRRAGRLRAIGVSNFTRAELSEADAALGETPLASAQESYSLIDRRVDDEGIRALARARGVGLLAYAPLAQGLLAGRTLDGPPLPADDGRREHPLFQPRNLARLHAALRGTLLPIAEAHAVAPGAVALAWLLGRPGVSAVIVGIQQAEQVAPLASAATLALSAEESARLDRDFRALGLDRALAPSLARRLLRRLRRVVRRHERTQA